MTMISPGRGLSTVDKFNGCAGDFRPVQGCSGGFDDRGEPRGKRRVRHRIPSRAGHFPGRVGAPSNGFRCRWPHPRSGISSPATGRGFSWRRTRQAGSPPGYRGRETRTPAVNSPHFGRGSVPHLVPGDTWAASEESGRGRGWPRQAPWCRGMGYPVDSKFLA